MRTKKSGAKFSTIVEIGEQLRKKSQETGVKYLYLNRGVPSVVNIDLSKIIPQIDFNAAEMQVYPPNNGFVSLKNAINKVFFHNKASTDNIIITTGGMTALNLIFQNLDVQNIYLPKYFWGCYVNIMKIYGIKYFTYNNFSDLRNNLKNLKNSAVIICDPNNPVGNKYDDNELLNLIKLLNDNEAVIIWDGPYRRIFYEEEADNFYENLLCYDNVVIAESFSKSIGLSGQRIGFAHAANKEFNDELAIRLLYGTNGTNTFSQILVEKILTTSEGITAGKNFRKKTIEEINKNIEYLIRRKLLLENLYIDAKPIGIFVILNKSFDELLKYNIASVPLTYFTLEKEEAGNYARINIAVSNKEFVEYFDRIK
ncbi:MAG: pyridoxal phosphate-dependent aminotransferase [Bacteroidia bacterium]|nr:pyridoxal phosphate-dependent aminotransferase [Bacteroidia bacterium]